MLCLRTLVMYVFLELVMRRMGKRQLAQLEMSELVTTLLLSELAALPLGNPDVPLSHAVVPILTLMGIEILTALILLRFPRLRQHDRNTPSLLIRRGQIDHDQLRKNRMTPEELFSALRAQGVGDPTEVEYAILEKNGTLSVLPCAAARPATPRDLGCEIQEEGMMHLLISDGVIQSHTLASLGRDRAWLEHLCAARSLRVEEVFCLMCNDAGRVIFICNGQHRGCRPWQEEITPK